jgi:hypothetical protein
MQQVSFTRKAESASFLLALFLIAAPAFAQFTTTLQQRTIDEFDRYAQKIEQQLTARWHGSGSFLSIEDDAADREKVLAGELLVRPGNPGNPVEISDGLVHDWFGAVFIPNTNLHKVMDILQNFDRHSQIYPSVVRSRLVERKGSDITGYWRLQRQQGLLTIALDVEQEAHYQEVGPGKWICRAYAKNISEVDHPGSAREKKLPSGHGQGFLWRLYAYWSLEAANGGVLAECRTLSLSRSIPAAVAWAITPFVQSLPRESLAATLRDTRDAAAK